MSHQHNVWSHKVLKCLSPNVTILLYHEVIKLTWRESFNKVFLHQSLKLDSCIYNVFDCNGFILHRANPDIHGLLTGATTALPNSPFLSSPTTEGTEHRAGTGRQLCPAALHRSCACGCILLPHATPLTKQRMPERFSESQPKLHL